MKRYVKNLLVALTTGWWLNAHAAAFDATLQWAEKVELGMPASGIVAVVDVAPGDQVTKGQLLVALREAPFKAKIDEAEAIVTQRAADRREAERDYEQAKELYDRTVLSTVELENAKLRATRAGAALRDARAKLALARIDLENSRILAPFDAWVLDVRVRPNETVVSTLKARPLVVVTARGELAAGARVPAGALANLKIGQTVRVQVAGRSYDGKVKSIALEPGDHRVDAEDLYRVVVRFKAPDTLIPSGQSAVVELP